MTTLSFSYFCAKCTYNVKYHLSKLPKFGTLEEVLNWEGNRPKAKCQLYGGCKCDNFEEIKEERIKDYVDSYYYYQINEDGGGIINYQ
jgi:hypothetical protein